METYLQYRRIGQVLKKQLESDVEAVRSLPCLSQQRTRIVDGRPVLVVEWDGPDDPLHPRNWPFHERFRATLVVCSIGCLVGAAASFDGAVIPQAAKDLGVSQVTESFGAISSFLLGFGPGALICGPFSEVLGRNQIYLPSLVLLCLFITASALAPDIGSQIVFRFLASVVGAAPSVCAGGSMADMFTALEKTFMFPFFSIFGFGGAALGPVMSAWIPGSPVLHSWRWAEWVTLMFAGVVLLATFLFQPETYPPILLSWKARHLSKITGDDRYYAEHEIERISLLTRLRAALRRPFTLALHEPIILLVSFYLCLVYIILFTFLNGYDFIFRQTYGISQGLTNTIFVGIFVGVCIAFGFVPWIYKRTVEAQRKEDIDGKTQFNPEIRLWYAMLGAPAMPISLFWMAWTSHPHISIWSSIVASALFGYAGVMAFITTYMYLIDTYETYAASALVFATLSRYFCSGGMVVAATPFYQGVGHHWTLTILGCVSILLTPIPYVFYRYGHIIRRKSRFAVTGNSGLGDRQLEMPVSMDSSPSTLRARKMRK